MVRESACTRRACGTTTGFFQLLLMLDLSDQINPSTASPESRAISPLTTPRPDEAPPAPPTATSARRRAR
jgi:hypothetical protein